MVDHKDKKLVDNFVKHATTHNRVLEEEYCWREIKRRYKKSNDSRDRSPVSNYAQSEQQLDALERALRADAKRKLELQATRSLPSAAGGQNAKEFWRTLARQHCDTGRWGHDGWEELQNEGPIPFRRSNTTNTGAAAASDDGNYDSVKVKTASLPPKLPYQYTVEKETKEQEVKKPKKKAKHKISHSKSKRKHAKRKRKSKLKKAKKLKKKKGKSMKARSPSSSSSTTSSSSSSSTSSSSSSSSSSSRASSPSHSSASSTTSSTGSDDEVEWQELKVQQSCP